MKHRATNEVMIDQFSPEILSIYYMVKARNPNSIIYKNRERASRKMGVDRSTLSRWIAVLREAGLAIKQDNGNVQLLPIWRAMAAANDGIQPKYKCTLAIGQEYTRQQIENELRKKLLSRKHRQIVHVRRETKIEEIIVRKYGAIHDRKSKEKVKSRIDVQDEVGVPLSGKTAAKAMGISERKWHKLRKQWIADGSIASFPQREELALWMSMDQYAKARPQLGFASYRKRSGQIVRVEPNLIHVRDQYRRPDPVTDQPAWYFIKMEIRGREMLVARPTQDGTGRSSKETAFYAQA